MEWNKILMHSSLRMLSSELDNIVEHLLRNNMNHIKFDENTNSNFFKNEILFYKTEFDNFFINSEKRTEKLEKEWEDFNSTLNKKSIKTEEEFHNICSAETYFEENFYVEEITRRKHLVQEFSSFYELFEGTLRQCTEYHKNKSKIKLVNRTEQTKNGREEFEKYLMQIGIFPKNNSEWKRINGVYEIIYNTIKHNDLELPNKDFGLKAIINYEEKRLKNNKKTIFSENLKKIIINDDLINDFTTDLISFSEIKNIKELIDEYYMNKGKYELPKTLDCYNSFSDMYHRIENALDYFCELYDKINNKKIPFASIKKTGFTKIKEYILENNILQDILEDEYFIHFGNFYRPLENHIKHNKGNLVPINEENKIKLSNLMNEFNYKNEGYLSFENNVLNIDYRTIIRFSEETNEFLKRLEKKI